MGVYRFLAAPLRRPARFLIPVLVAGLGATSLGRLWPPRYRATAVVRVEQAAPGASVEREILGTERLQKLAEHLDVATGAKTGPPTPERLERLRTNLTVRGQGRDTFALDYVDGDPQKAADVLQQLTRLLTEGSDGMVDSSSAPDPLAARLAQAKRELEEKEASLRRFIESRAGTLPEQREANLATLERLRQERNDVAAALQEVIGRQSAPAIEPSAAGQDGGASAELVSLRAELARLRMRYTELHPDVQKLRAKIARLERPPSAKAGAGDRLETSPADVKGLEARQQELDERILSFEARLQETTRTELQLASLSQELETFKKRYLDLLNQKLSARLAATVETSAKPASFRLVEPTRRPEHPVSAERGRLVWGTLAVGLLLGWAFSLVGVPRPPAAQVGREFEHPRRMASPPPATPAAIVAATTRPAPSPTPRESTLQRLQEPIAPAMDAAPETQVIPAGLAASASPAAFEDLLEPGSVFLRPPQPARASGSAWEPTPAVPTPAAPTDGAEDLLEPGAIFWSTPARSKTDTQPIPILSTIVEAAGEPPPPTVEPTRQDEAQPLPMPELDRAPLPLPQPPPPPPMPIRLAPAEQPAPILEPAEEEEQTPATAALDHVATQLQPAALAPPDQHEGVAERSVPGMVVSGGAAHGSVLVLPPSPSERLLGAAAYCHLRVDLPNVAPVHARVVSDGLGLSLADAGSSTGTYVNNRRIAGRYPLKNGDQVSLGPPGSQQSVRLLVYLPPPSERAVAVTHPASAPAGPASTTRATADHRPMPRPLPPRPPSTAPVDVLPPAARPRVERQRPFSPSGAPTLVSRRPLATAATLAVLVAGGFLARRMLTRPSPVLAEVAPARARPGQTIQLSGSGFDRVADKNTVRLGGYTASVVSASESRLEIAVPRDLPLPLPAAVTVSVEVAGRRSGAASLSVVAAPSLTRLEPPVARRGDTVTALGGHLAGQPVTVHVAGVTAEIVDVQPTSLRFRVPVAAPLPEGGRVPVDVSVAGETAERAFLVVGQLPFVTELAPPRGPVGEHVTLRGYGFDPDPTGNRVHFGEREALVLSSSPTELTVSAPAAGPVLAAQAALPVTVLAHAAASSSPAVFTLLGPPSGMFLPHFFAAPVSELPAGNHAFVSTELGPVMLLTGPAGSSSTAERAARVARVLNDLVEQAAKPLALAFEVEPVPSVALAGGSYLVATATPRDALGYEGLWAKLGRPGRATPHSIATYWTALLQDYLTLFVQHQRPTHVLELSARGQLLADIHTEAVKAAGGPKGVPTEVLRRLRASLADGLREMALLLPAPGQSNPGAVVVGRWNGSMEEGDKGAQPIHVRLFFEGRRLAGSLTRKSPRGVAGETRLRDVTYEGGALAFALPVGSAMLHFNGTVREDAMAGLIRGGPQARQAVGFFSLSYVE